ELRRRKDRQLHRGSGFVHLLRDEIGAALVVRVVRLVVIPEANLDRRLAPRGRARRGSQCESRTHAEPAHDPFHASSPSVELKVPRKRSSRHSASDRITSYSEDFASKPTPGMSGSPTNPSSTAMPSAKPPKG